ncbi:hypothetical protein C0Q70_17703 [Pomacea canaliculata]|uniref:Uncharacterized protein n=1 Tax=Pomacea canaliculata TaxID=400727 RepID=A0A2T7NL55_POMCA|nr:hypothetical protein C0Q70_17703 [Pomacea canaliculata]
MTRCAVSEIRLQREGSSLWRLALDESPRLTTGISHRAPPSGLLVTCPGPDGRREALEVRGRGRHYVLSQRARAPTLRTGPVVRSTYSGSSVASNEKAAVLLTAPTCSRQLSRKTLPVSETSHKSAGFTAKKLATPRPTNDALCVPDLAIDFLKTEPLPEGPLLGASMLEH